MNKEEKQAIEEFRKQLKLAINIDDVTTDIRNDNAEILLNLIEKLQKENEELLEVKVSASAHNRMLELEKEKSKYEWIRQNCLPQELVNKLYIPIQKIKDKIEELKKEYNKLDKQVDECIKSVEKDVSTYYENKERISIMQTLSYFIDTLQELLEGRK